MPAMQSVQIQGVTLHLSQPHNAETQWIGQREILKQLLACWLVVAVFGWSLVRASARADRASGRKR